MITFNRKNPGYYQEGVPLVDDTCVVYINFDGFARYYYDELLKEYTPFLESLKKEGVFFDDLRNALPSVTNPCQNMILSGATSIVTKNVYRYYDRKENIVIQQLRENKSRILADIAVANKIPTISVAHYLTEPYLTYDNPDYLYVTANNETDEVLRRGKEKYGDHFARFEQLIKIIKKEEIITKDNKVKITKLPKLLIFYADDLDGIGHNEVSKYGYKLASSEEERLENIKTLLKEMDNKLKEFIETCKKENVYDNMTIFLTTDHGMTPFGLTSYHDKNDYGTSKLVSLKETIESFSNEYKFEMLLAKESPKNDTTVVGVGTNLNMQLTFKKDITDETLDSLKKHILKNPYVEIVKTRKELADEGYYTYAADMIVTPKGRYFFSRTIDKEYFVRGQHDSSLDSANKIVGFVFGKGIKKNYIYQEKAYNYDFGTTMAAVLGIKLPNSNGVILDIFNRNNK